MLQGNQACVHNTTTEPTNHIYWSLNTPEPVLRKKRRCDEEKPVHRSQRVAPASYNWRKACAAMKTQHNQIKQYQKQGEVG